MRAARKGRKARAAALAAVLLGSLLPLMPEAARGQIPPVAFDALLFTRTEGFRHASIEPAVEAMNELALANGFNVETTEDPAAFNDANLARFEVVVFLLTTGDVLGPEKQKAFRRYIEGGGAFAGVHSASDTEYDWPFYGRLVGAYFESHARFKPGRVLVLDRVHPSTSHLPARWDRIDEWYNFRANPRGRVHVLATLDEDSYEGKKMGPDHPISWCRDLSGARTWYTGLGHTIESYGEPAFRQHLLGGVRWAAGDLGGGCTGTVWKTLARTTLDRDTVDPLALEVAPDGRVFFVERQGKVKLYDPSTETTSVVAELDVFAGNEDGLLGVALDPDFLVNRWVYLFYSPAAGEPRQRVSRFTFALGALDPTSEQVLLEIPTQRELCCHSAGALAFGPDGNLFISTGDNTFPFASDGFAPLDERPGKEVLDAQRTAGNTNDLRGKILRIDPQPDGSYGIPEGNLFPVGTPKTRPEIYVMGLRNPFRMSVDPDTGRLFWGDVGPDARSGDPRRGPKGFDEFNVADAAGNFGWPYCLANNKRYRAYDFRTGTSGARFDCEGGPRNGSPNNSGRKELPPAEGAMIFYPYGPSRRFPLIGRGPGRAGFAGPLYRLPPAATSGSLPGYFDGVLFVFDWARKTIKEVHFDDEGALLQIAPFMDGTDFRRPIDMDVGPDGSLYLLEWGSRRLRGNPDSRLVRIASASP